MDNEGPRFGNSEYEYPEIIEIKKIKECFELIFVDQEQLKKYKEILKETREMHEVDIPRLSWVARLKSISQVPHGDAASKEDLIQHIPDYGDFSDEIDVPVGSISMLTPPHSRFDHSHLFAEITRALGVKLGRSLEDIRLMMCAAWFHDRGHSVFSHEGEHVIVNNGGLDHESFGVVLLEENDITEFLEKYNIDKSRLINIMQEKEILFGEIQKILDTLSYAVLDSSVRGKPVYDDYGAIFLQDVCGVEQYEGEEHIVFKSREAVQKLMDARSVLYAEWYLHHENRIKQEAKQKLFKKLFDENSDIKMEDMRSTKITE
ncbi:MAG: HD domain-containing protein, partial [Patescibacteria group bacterium]|nr:HD domain-containing protein [Patescibacteria group bacterium]